MKIAEFFILYSAFALKWGDQPDSHRAQTPSRGVMLLLHHDHHLSAE